jgi:hypothetical protein
MLFIEELVQKGARSCALVLPATRASGWAGVVYPELPPARGGSPNSGFSIEYPPSELEVLERACELKDVIKQHRGHQGQIAAQDL